jgi:hypothetical protein
VDRQGQKLISQIAALARTLRSHDAQSKQACRGAGLSRGCFGAGSPQSGADASQQSPMADRLGIGVVAYKSRRRAWWDSPASAANAGDPCRTPVAPGASLLESETVLDMSAKGWTWGPLSASLW